MKIVNKKIKYNRVLFKGFTLIELLAVIIILAIIAIIATPVVLNVVDDARNSADFSSAQLIAKSGHNYYADSLLDKEKANNVNNLTDIYSELEIESKPESGQLYVNNKDQVAMAIVINNKCYKKEFTSEIEVVDVSECDLGYIGKDETAPEITQEVNNTTSNANGWYKEDIYVEMNITDSESGVAGYKRCMGQAECEPGETIHQVEDKIFINTESANNYVCVIGVDKNGNESEKNCVIYKLDKTLPTISGVGDITAMLNDVVDLTNNVTYNDALSGIEGQLIINPTNVDTSTIGTKQVTYTIKDMAGNVREVIRNIIVDANAPTITFNLVDNSLLNSNGWINKDFYIRANITDNSGTGIKEVKSCTTNSSSECSPVIVANELTKNYFITTEGSNRACIEVTDNNNKTTKVCSDTYKLDKTAPIAGTANLVGTMGANNWYTTDVAINVINGTDVLSGHTSTTSNITNITSNTTGTTVTITTTDLAGNTATRSYTIKVDKNSPTITAKSDSVTITEGDNNPVSNYFTVSYGISGGSISCNPTNTSGLSVGTQTVSCTVTGGNGKTATSSKAITVKAVPVSFANDSWETIADAVKTGNTSKYKVGDTKEVTLTGTYAGTYTVRIANMSTPEECATEGFSQTACGFVVEFVDIITTHNMKSTDDNTGGWPNTDMRTFVNEDIYNVLPGELQSIIIDTYTVSSRGIYFAHNFTSIDKLYLLSTKEVWASDQQYDLATNQTRQLDYYKNNDVDIGSSSGAVKNYQGSATRWWLRSAYSYSKSEYYFVSVSGRDSNIGISATNVHGVAPAFKIG